VDTNVLKGFDREATTSASEPVGSGIAVDSEQQNPVKPQSNTPNTNKNKNKKKTLNPLTTKKDDTHRVEVEEVV